MLRMPLYYTGLVKVARVSQVQNGIISFLYSFIHEENQARGKWESFILKRDYSIDLPIDLAPVSLTYFVIM